MVTTRIGVLLSLAACSDSLLSPVTAPASDGPAEAAPAPQPMAATDLLTRASLDLRGARPTVAEIERVEADPAAVDTMIDEFMDDPRFGGRVRDLFSEIYLTRQDYFYVSAADYGLSDEAGFAAAVGNEGLHILSRIAEDDLPYDEIVLGDWTMANELLGGAWPVDYVDTYGAEATGWQLAHYTDGRPAAGLLATNGMWWRYMTNTSNANRGRANAVSRILLCSDYLTRPIAFDRDVNLLDQGAVNDALRTNSGCVACHNTLDPLASYFWGFYYVFYDSKIDTTEYHADREYTWQSVTGVEPGYYGLPGSSLADLGRHIAEDPRLYSCVTEQVFSLLNRRSVVLEDTGSLLEHAATFAADDYRLRSLFRSVMAGSEYRSAPSDDPRMTSSKMVSADLMASQIEDLTGFHFDYAGYDMLRTDTYGLRTLAGGVDGVYNLQPALEPTATMMLVQERLAEAAADYVVGQDRASPATARLFTEVGFLETPDTNADAMVRQVQLLHLRVLGNRVAADGPEVEANLELWNELFAATGSIPDAWEGLLATLMRDPDFLLY